MVIIIIIIIIVRYIMLRATFACRQLLKRVFSWLSLVLDPLDRVVGSFMKSIQGPVKDSRLLYGRSTVMNAYSPNLDDFLFSIYKASLLSGHIL